MSDTVDTPTSSGDPDLSPGTIAIHDDGSKYVVAGHDDGAVLLGEIGDRYVDDCPVEEGDTCIDPDCDGRIGEKERDKETMSAHERYCYECGLHWVERGEGGRWEEEYSDYYTRFTYTEGDT